MVDKGKCRALLVCLLLFVAAGCDPGGEVLSPPPPVELVRTAEPAPEPALINPVKAVFEELMAFAEPISAALSESEDVRALSCSLSLDMQLQRLKQFFAIFRNLPAAGEDYWEGALVGAMQGSASVTGAEGDCVFSAVFWDGTKIEGSVRGNDMRADWLYSETIAPEPPVMEDGELPDRDPEPEIVWHVFRTAHVTLEEGKAFASLYWEDGFAGLLFRDNGIYFAQEREQAISDQPDDWAEWNYMDGAIQKYERATPDDNGQPGEGAGEEGMEGAEDV